MDQTGHGGHADRLCDLCLRACRVVQLCWRGEATGGNGASHSPHGASIMRTADAPFTVLLVMMAISSVILIAAVVFSF